MYSDTFFCKSMYIRMVQYQSKAMNDAIISEEQKTLCNNIKENQRIEVI